MNKRVVTIEPAKMISHKAKLPSMKKRRVAGYARVSTDHEEQASSYESQMKYYTQYISSRHDWDFVKMYSDEGISGTNAKKRLGFQEMIEDALAGKIDLILTKSVSRFARNTVDSLSTVRKLKEVGVEIYFEKENIWTLDSKGELLITIMSSLAQEESRSISENVTWGKRKLAAEGKVSFSYSQVLGFKKNDEGGFEIDEDEAQIVRYIFGRFLDGSNPNSIAKELTEKGIPTPAGKTNWSYSTIRRMLQNEKYKGDALLQKSFTTDFLTKMRKANHGELPQYYVENNHAAIIDKNTFDFVQQELKQRNSRSSKSYFGKITCGCCGGNYGSHVWHSNNKYRRKLYRCNSKYKNEIPCDTPHVTSQEIETWSIDVINQILTNKEEVIENLNELMALLGDTSELEQEINNLECQLLTIQTQVEALVSNNAKVVQDQTIYQKNYDELVEIYRQKQELHETTRQQLFNQIKKKQELKTFIEALAQEDKLVTEFDKTQFNTFIEKLVINKGKKVTVVFKNEVEIRL